MSFEPSPPGAVRLGTLSSGFSSSLGLFQNGAGGPQRIAMIEAWGYSTLDRSTAPSPTALRYDDLRFSPTTPVKATGDGQSYIQTMGVSPDGQRIVFSVNGPAEPTWHTIVGRPDGNEGFGIYGDFGASRASATVVQQIGGRYIAYALQFAGSALAADITNLPANLTSLNMPSEVTTFPAGLTPSLAGNYLVYNNLSSGGIEVIDASSPGPVGSITRNFKSVAITSATFNRTPVNYAAAVDPFDATKLWVLVETAAASGENSPSYGLVSITKDAGGNLSAPVPAGPLFRVPSAAGETWNNVGNSASLVASNGSLFVLMWATRSLPSQQFVLYSTTTAAWGLGYPVPVAASGFALAMTRASALAGPGNSVNVYIPTGAHAFVVPLTCYPINAPASAGLTVANGTVPVPDGGSAFVGDTLTIVPQVAPPSSFNPLTGWAWNFDFDFHVGSIAEDRGAGSHPRIGNPDNGVFLNPPAPPAQITYVGPCDPKNSGDPTTGSGCWASLKTNSAFGGPDVTGTEKAGDPPKPLKIAFEANNQYGSANTSVFTVNWQFPATRLQSTSVFIGQPLVSSSDGHPVPNGFKWYFGSAPAALVQAPCTTSACIPTLDMKGTYYYWLTATYPNGYSTPDYAGTPMGTYTVTDFSPAFTVNGATLGPVTTVVGSNLSVGNTSQRGSSVTGTYSYSFCQAPCTDSFQPWSTMTDPPAITGTPATYANVPVPAAATAGTWSLRIRIDYTGGTTYWPDPNPNGAAFPVNVTNVTPDMHIFVNGLDPCGFVGCILNRVNARVGDALTAYSYVGSQVDPATVTIHWDFPGATPTSGNGNGVSFSYATPGIYDLTLTRNGVAYPFPGSAVISPKPLAAAASATPNPALQYVPVTFTCTASWGSGTYVTYAWTFGDGQSGAGVTASHSYGTPGAFSPTCRVTDSNGTTVTSPALPLAITASPLVASAAVTPTSVALGVPAQFSCSATGGLAPYTYSWAFSDGQTATGATAAHTFAAAGAQTGTCTVVDSFSPANRTISSASLNVIAPPSVLYTLTPCRILDTRNPVGTLGAPAILPAGTADRSFPLTGVCGIPATAIAVSTNVTVTNVAAAGVLSIYPGNVGRTGTNTVAFRAGQTRANNAILALSSDGRGTVAVQNTSAGALDVIIDVNGYFAP